MHSASEVLRKHWRLISFVLAIIVISWILYALRSVILPFAIGLVLAYLFLPLIRWAEQKLPRQGKLLRTKRISLIILLFILMLAMIGLLAFFIVTAVIHASSVLLNNASRYIVNSLFTIEDWVKVFREQLPAEYQTQIDQFILNAGITLGNFIKNSLIKGISFIPSTFSLILGFGALPLFLFYLLKDSERLSKGFYSGIPPWIAEHTRNIVLIIEMVLGRYIRAQLLLGAVVAYFTFIGLLALGLIAYAPALATVAGVSELIPALGPWIGGAVALMVTLAVDPSKAIWVALLFVIIQLLENYLLVPRIQGGYLRIHPAVLLILMVVGAYVAGFWGILLIGPFTATVVEVYKYIRRSNADR